MGVCVPRRQCQRRSSALGVGVSEATVASDCRHLPCYKRNAPDAIVARVRDVQSLLVAAQHLQRACTCACAWCDGVIWVLTSDVAKKNLANSNEPSLNPVESPPATSVTSAVPMLIRRIRPKSPTNSTLPSPLTASELGYVKAAAVPRPFKCSVAPDPARVDTTFDPRSIRRTR